MCGEVTKSVFVAPEVAPVAKPVRKLRVKRRHKRKRIRKLRGGIKRIIHVVAKALQANKETGKNGPVIGIRLASRPEKVVLVRHVKILGPSTLRHTPNDPVPGTDGRAVCVLRTSAPLEVSGWPKKKRRRRRKAA